MSEYLVELLLEEMPPADVDMITKKLGKIVENALNGANVGHGDVEAFSTARRFGFFIHDLQDRQDDVILKKRGPAQRIAYKDGKPSKALEGFLASNSATVEDVEFVDVKGTPYIFLKKIVAGRPTSEVLKEIVPKILLSLAFKRPMRWGDGEYKYVRPLHSIVSILNDKIIEFEMLGKSSSNMTKSHRYLSEDVIIKEVSEYVEKLKDKMVIIHTKERKKMIEEAITQSHLDVVKDDDLIHEVALISEYPQAVVGEFQEKYLGLPEEVLKTVLRHHQRTFVARDGEKTSKKFLAFQDGPSLRSKNVRKGYERVINARLEDATFYYNEDTTVPFESFVSKLKGVTFQKNLGTLYDKVERVKALSEDIAKKLEFNDDDVNLVRRAAFLSKADIATSMIYEFPELQGTMGKIYTLHDEDPRVAKAMEEQYMPNGLEGNMPVDVVGAVVGLADRLDTVMSNFSIGEIPSGSSDPYGLRKNTFSILKILNEFEWDLNIEEEGTIVESLLDKGVPWKEVSEFFKGRLEVVLKETYNISPDVARTVLNLWRFPLRVRLAAQTIDKYRNNEGFEDFIVAYTRVHNISSKYDSNEYHVELFEEKEKPLFTGYIETKPKIEEALEHLNYDEAFEHLRSLKPIIDDYFEKVFVMATREDLRRNRLGFLKSLDEMFLKFGSLSLLSK